MLTSQAIGCDIVTVDNDTVIYWVALIFNEATNIVVSSPEPSIINYDMARIDFNHGSHRYLLCQIVGRSTNSSKHIVERNRVGSITSIVTRTNLKERIRVG